MGNELGRRDVLRAGGLLSLGAVLAACSGANDTTATPARSAPPSSAGTTSAPPSSAAAGRSPVDLLPAAGTCALTPTTIAGPTWFDASLVRSDVRDGRPGVPLDLAFRVARASGCAPVPNAAVDLWQCDADGMYSGFAGVARGAGGQPDGRDRYGDPQSRATTSERFLRGAQVTGPDGVVQFRTVYPGWYPTRTAHLHVKVHVTARTVFTGQLFFDDAATDAVYAQPPYRADRDTRNARDPFFKPAAQLQLARDRERWLGAIVLGIR